VLVGLIKCRRKTIGTTKPGGRLNLKYKRPTTKGMVMSRNKTKRVIMFLAILNPLIVKTKKRTLWIMRQPRITGPMAIKANPEE
jgi:hypothetical protein